MFRVAGFTKALAQSRTKTYEDIKAGLLPEPVKIGERFAVWPGDEIVAVIAARTAGWEDERIRELVRQLVAARAHAADDLARIVPSLKTDGATKSVRSVSAKRK